MVSMKTKSALIADITALVGAIGDKFDSGDDEDAERDFMVQRCPKRLEETIRSLPTLSMHLLAALADGPVSLVGLATRSRQLKGTVSKHVQRLVDAGLVTRSPIPGNRKEIELTLTSDGLLVIEAHSELHDEIAAGFREFLMRYPSSELEVLVKVLVDVMAARKIGVRISPGE